VRTRKGKTPSLVCQGQLKASSGQGVVSYPCGHEVTGCTLGELLVDLQQHLDDTEHAEGSIT